MRTIKYSVTDKEHEIIRRCAAVKGNTPSSMSKHAVFQFVARFPPKGIFDTHYEKEVKKPSKGNKKKAMSSDGPLYIHCLSCDNDYKIKCPKCGETVKAHIGLHDVS